MSTRETPVEDSAVARRLAIDEGALRFVDYALAEDIGSGDWTTRWTVPPRTRIKAELVARAEGIVAGVALAAAVFRRLNARIEASLHRGTGEVVSAGDVIATIRGPARALMAGERTALGILARMSGLATAAQRYVSAVSGTGAAILVDTGTPGWRVLDAEAIRAGGAVPHRVALGDAVVLGRTQLDLVGSITDAVRRVRDQNARTLRVEVEVQDEAGASEAAAAGADTVRLGSADPTLARVVAARLARARPRPLLCVAADVAPEGARDLATVGADAILVLGLSGAVPPFPVVLACSGT